ncbi:MAG: hypothetical protein J0M33_02655 [Anaerolineae bacterium]|nr:hypothetical protein [Anaerolineae bacterium]
MTDKAPLIITLTLPESADETKPGTLLVERNYLAHVRQFSYTRLSDLGDIIAEGLMALAVVAADPPVIAEGPKAEPKPAATHKTTAKASDAPVEAGEPTIDIPLKKGSLKVKISHLKIVDGDTDAEAYALAMRLAGRLVDGKLWDGKTPIRFEDVYAAERKMKHLTAADFALFTLEDFIQPA